jgi:phytoene dehydrogenase-like protein
MQYDAVIVGGGMAGLTTAAYLSKAGRKILLCEKEEEMGGLVASFQRGGFTWDAGIRAIESSGIVHPMLRQLGIEIDFLPSTVSVGIGPDVMKVASRESLADYQALLVRHFPADAADIERIVAEVRRVMGYLDVLYGIDNPLFLDLMKDPKYLVRTILPWIARYALTMPKIGRLMLPVGQHLARLGGSRAMRDMVEQHFFKETPAYFALSYFTLYLDYRYPRGGTGTLPRKMVEYVRNHGGEIRTGAQIVRVDAGARTVTDASGRVDSWQRLVWAADQKALFRALDGSTLRDTKVRAAAVQRGSLIADKKGGDSVFTVYLAADVEPGYFADIASAHFFYTPLTTGLSTVDLREIAASMDEAGRPGAFTSDKARVFEWTRRYLERTTCEISIPVLRDPSLAPAGKTGLIVSTLTEHALFAHARAMGWEEEHQRLCMDTMEEVLAGSIFPRLRGAVRDAFCSTPLSLERRTANAEGAITGWAFTNRPVPAVHGLPAIATSIRTPVPGILQAGQWTFSPSGLPISILTGKLAADRVLRELR